MNRYRHTLLWIAVLGVPAVGLLGAVIAGLVIRGEFETEQSATRSFTIDEDFTKVRKILVRKKAAEQLVAMGGGSEFLSQRWSGGDAEVESLRLLDPQWKLDLHGTLRVRTRDDYVGQQDIALEQDVAITPDSLHSEVKLTKSAERLRDYRMTTQFDRDDSAGQATGVTRVELQLAQRILTEAPWFAHDIADRRVRASVEQTLANQEAAIRKLIADNIDDVPLLPLR